MLKIMYSSWTQQIFVTTQLKLFHYVHTRFIEYIHKTVITFLFSSVFTIEILTQYDLQEKILMD